MLNSSYQFLVYQRMHSETICEYGHELLSN